MPQIDFPIPVKTLVAALKRLPGIGPRSAERIAVWMLQHPESDTRGLAETITAASDAVRPCPVCGFFATRDGCAACDDPKRDESLLCVVEQATDVIPLERAGVFKGRYHCLGGKLSPLDGVGPEDLNIDALLRRIDAATSAGDIEVILALGSDVEGEATANYLASMLRPRGCTLTRIAQGLPAGGGLEHADDLTLTRAMQGRRGI
ncbi:MAG: recombination mediator RecR [Luteolibacter sp.]|jgi:recombination protein RecR